MKRKFNSNVSDHTRSKKPKLVMSQDFNNKNELQWVSATHIRNYMMKDTLVDWLKLRSRRGTRSNPAYTKHSGGFSTFIMKKGIFFERELIKYISENLTPVITVADRLSDAGCEKTRLLMLQGVPVLHSAPIKHKHTNTGGIIDLLVRSDYINKLVNVCPMTKEEQTIKAPKLKGKYHYIVIDIKFCTLPLKSDGIHLLNSGSVPFYKAQCWIYTRAISEIQGYTSKYSFLMGRRWRYTKKDIKYHNYTCLDKLGTINYEEYDKKYIEITEKAVKWVRDVQDKGDEWTTYPPSRPELYPNMCVNSGLWTKEKEIIANRIGEITSVWYCGIKNRVKAIKNGVSSWRDVNCKSDIMGITGTRAPVIDKIMSINRQKKDKLWPAKIKNNMFNWKRTGNELFVDFETLADIFSDFDNLPKQDCTDMIFMIGVGWCDKGIWKYRNFICEKPTYKEEYRIMNEFVFFMKKRKWPRIYYWHAEKTFWAAAENRQFDIAHQEENWDKKDHISDIWKKVSRWADISKLFRTEPIVIKDCFKYNLKAIAKAMRSHKMISAKIDSNCDSGMVAMVNAWECYKSKKNPVQCSVMNDIGRYNEFDCKVLWEIMTYLRKYHK